MSTMLTLTAAECRGVIFDMDGVVTDTARVHARAWKQMFDDYLGRRAARREGPFQPFDLVTDYRRYVDGKAREDGVRSFLASRGIPIEEGHPGDPSDRETGWARARTSSSSSTCGWTMRRGSRTRRT